MTPRPATQVGIPPRSEPAVKGPPRQDRDLATTVRSQLAEAPSLLRFTIASLDRLAAELDAADPEDSDLVLVLPTGGAAVLAEPDELIDAAGLAGGICVAASPFALASPHIAQQIEKAVAEAAGRPVQRCHPYPYALVGPAGALRSLLADAVEGESDADRITNAVLSGGHDVIIDTEGEFFGVLDGIAGRAYGGAEQPLVLIDPTPDHHALTTTTSGEDIDPSVPVLQVQGAVISAGSERADGLRLLRFSTASLGQLAAELDAADANDTDVVLAVPINAAAVLAETDELIDAAQLSGGIWLAASPLPMTSPAIAERIEQAVAEAAGGRVPRCHPYPYALVGQAGALQSLLADAVEGDNDADRITNAVLSGRHDVIIDTVGEFFYVLDGTGTDATIIAGRAYAGDEQPLVLIDPTPDHHALAII